jgi:hypothetical protein
MASRRGPTICSKYRYDRSFLVAGPLLLVAAALAPLIRSRPAPAAPALSAAAAGRAVTRDSAAASS